MKLGEFLINKRKEFNLSLREAALKLNISHSYLAKLENGYDDRSGMQNNPRPETLLLISNGYNASYVELLRLSGYLDSLKIDEQSNLEYKEVIALAKKSNVSAETLTNFINFIVSERNNIK